MLRQPKTSSRGRHREQVCVRRYRAWLLGLMDKPGPYTRDFDIHFAPLAEIEADPAILTGYDSSLTTSQLQALNEVLTGPAERET